MHPEQVLRKSKTSFATAFIGLDPRQKRALTAIYAYCRVIDDIVDEQDPRSAEKELQAWKNRLSNLERQEDVLSKELHWSVSEFSMDVSNLDWLIQGVNQDLTKQTYQDWNELLVYCDAVASSVGHMCMEIFETPKEISSGYVFSTGRALQLTNIIRDVFMDAKMGRVYIPKDQYEKFGIVEKDFFDQIWSDDFESMMVEVIKKSLDFYQQSDQEKKALDAKKIWPAEVMKKVYFETLKKIQKNPKNVLYKKVSISKMKKFWISQSLYLRAQL